MTTLVLTNYWSLTKINDNVVKLQLHQYFIDKYQKFFELEIVKLTKIWKK